MVQLSSVRSSVFSNDVERTSYTHRLALIILNFLSTIPSLFDSSSCYHQFVRLLARFHSNFNLNDLVKLSSIEEYFQSIASFSLNSFKRSEENIVHYILGSWSRIINDIPYCKNATQQLLQHLTEFFPTLTIAFLTTRLDQIIIAIDNDELDQIFQTDILEDELKQLPSLARYNYNQTCLVLKERLEPTVQAYKQFLQVGQEGSLLTITSEMQRNVCILESQLSMFIYFFSSIIGSEKPVMNYSPSEIEFLDAELCTWFFSLSSLSDTRLSNQSLLSSFPASPHLSLSQLHFFQSFRIKYIEFQSTYSRTSTTLLTTNNTSNADVNEHSLYGRMSKMMGTQVKQQQVLTELVKKM